MLGMVLLYCYLLIDADDDGLRLMTIAGYDVAGHAQVVVVAHDKLITLTMTLLIDNW